jgi:prophage regulatory protein
MTNKALRLPAVKELTGLSRSSIYRLVQLGRFPAPVKLSERASAWRESEINQWLASRQPKAA